MAIHQTASAQVPATPEALYSLLTDFRSWPEWDKEVAHVEAPGGEVAVGTAFRLKPRGGPWISLLVEALEPPTLFADVSKLPFARMRTVHRFSAIDAGTTLVQIEISTSGPLAWLWDRIVARKQITGAAAQALAMAAFTRKVAR